MEDPTGGMWIYLIFIIIPLARIIPRMLKKYKRKNAGLEPEPAEKDQKRQFFASQSEFKNTEKNPQKNHNQNLTRKMAGLAKMTLSDKK